MSTLAICAAVGLATMLSGAALLAHATFIERQPDQRDADGLSAVLALMIGTALVLSYTLFGSLT